MLSRGCAVCGVLGTFKCGTFMKIYDCLSDAGVSSAQAAAPLNKDKCLHGKNATPIWRHYRLSNSVYRLGSCFFVSAESNVEQHYSAINRQHHRGILGWDRISLSWIDDSEIDMESRVMTMGSGRSCTLICCRPWHVVQACGAPGLVHSSGTWFRSDFRLGSPM
jgi:hypothetical protein